MAEENYFHTNEQNDRMGELFNLIKSLVIIPQSRWKYHYILLKNNWQQPQVSDIFQNIVRHQTSESPTTTEQSYSADPPTVEKTLYSHEKTTGRCGNYTQMKVSLGKVRVSTQLWVRWQQRCDPHFCKMIPSSQVRLMLRRVESQLESFTQSFLDGGHTYLWRPYSGACQG